MEWILLATRSFNRRGDSVLDLGVGVSRVGVVFCTSCIGGGSGNGLGGVGAESARWGYCLIGCGPLE